MGRRVSGVRQDELAIARAQEQHDEKRRLLAVHYFDRRHQLARGYQQQHRNVPRGLHHALAARDPHTHRSYLVPRALLFLEMLYEQAGPPDRHGRRKVFGRAQAYYAKRCGLSMKRNERSREPNGCRRIRAFLEQLEALNLAKRTGRHWYSEDDEHKRLVVTLMPWDETLPARFASSLSDVPTDGAESAAPPTLPEEPYRIPRSGCVSERLLLDSSGSGGSGGLEGKEAPVYDGRQIDRGKGRPLADQTDRPSAGANDEVGIASSGPAEVDATVGDGAAAPVLDARLLALALRTWDGPALRQLVQRIAVAHERPVDACFGRSAGRSRPASEPRSQRIPTRPHVGACFCERCQAWARDVVRGGGRGSATPTTRRTRAGGYNPAGYVDEYKGMSEVGLPTEPSAVEYCPLMQAEVSVNKYAGCVSEADERRREAQLRSAGRARTSSPATLASLLTRKEAGEDDADDT